MKLHFKTLPLSYRVPQGSFTPYEESQLSFFHFSAHASVMENRDGSRECTIDMKHLANEWIPTCLLNFWKDLQRSNVIFAYGVPMGKMVAWGKYNLPTPFYVGVLGGDIKISEEECSVQEMLAFFQTEKKILENEKQKLLIELYQPLDELYDIYVVHYPLIQDAKKNNEEERISRLMKSFGDALTGWKKLPYQENFLSSLPTEQHHQLGSLCLNLLEMKCSLAQGKQSLQNIKEKLINPDPLPSEASDAQKSFYSRQIKLKQIELHMAELSKRSLVTSLVSEIQAQIDKLVCSKWNPFMRGGALLTAKIEILEELIECVKKRINQISNHPIENLINELLKESYENPNMKLEQGISKRDILQSHRNRFFSTQRNHIATDTTKFINNLSNRYGHSKI